MKVRRIAIGAAIAGGVFGASAIAMAAFTTDTTPFSVSGQAGEVVQANADGQVVGTMMPGYYNDVQFRVNNPNGFPITIDQVTLADMTTYGDSGAVDPATCTAAFQAGHDLLGWDGTFGSVEAQGVVVPAGGSKDVTLTDALGMGSWATDDCQGASIELPLRVTFTVPAGSEL